MNQQSSMIQEQILQMDENLNPNYKNQQNQSKQEIQNYPWQQQAPPKILIHEVQSLKSIQQQQQIQKKPSLQQNEHLPQKEQKYQDKYVIQIDEQNGQKNQEQQKHNQSLEQIFNNDHEFRINVCQVQSKQTISGQQIQYLKDTEMDFIQNLDSFKQQQIVNSQNVQKMEKLQEQYIQQKQIDKLLTDRANKKLQQKLIKQSKLQVHTQVNAQDEKPQQDDFYVRKLQQKWAKRQQQQKLFNKNSISQENNQNQQKLNQNNSLNLNLNKQQKTKSTYIFKIKKIKDQKMSRTAQNFRNQSKNINKKQKKPNQLNIFATNSSQLLDLNLKKQQIKINKGQRKHLSNFQSVNRSIERTSTGQKQRKDISYQISLGNQVQMMSRILEDRYYNKNDNRTNFNDQNLKIGQQQINKIRSSQSKCGQNRESFSGGKIRKIIKRSPYGLLQIEVKQLKKTAKITNLRILKPKQMLKLKKISKISPKMNKQNLIQTKQTSNQQQVNIHLKTKAQNVKIKQNNFFNQLPPI